MIFFQLQRETSNSFGFVVIVLRFFTIAGKHVIIILQLKYEKDLNFQIDLKILFHRQHLKC
jgi:hypothetical protein